MWYGHDEPRQAEPHVHIPDEWACVFCQAVEKAILTATGARVNEVIETKEPEGGERT